METAMKADRLETSRKAGNIQPSSFTDHMFTQLEAHNPFPKDRNVLPIGHVHKGI
jgi:hypothetical protein